MERDSKNVRTIIDMGKTIIPVPVGDCLGEEIRKVCREDLIRIRDLTYLPMDFRNILEKYLIITEESSILTEESSILTEESSILTEESSILTEESSILTEESSILHDST